MTTIAFAASFTLMLVWLRKGYLMPAVVAAVVTLGLAVVL